MKEEILSKSHNTNKTKYKQIGRKQSSTIKDIDDKEIRNLLKKVPRDLIEMNMLILKRNKIMWEKFDKGRRSFLDFEDKRIYLYSLISVIVINILIYYLINNGIIDPEINSDSYLFMIIIQSIFLFISFGIIFSDQRQLDFLLATIKIPYRTMG